MRIGLVQTFLKLQTLLTELLVARGIAVHLIEGRTKEVASFREKITRASKAYVNPLVELTDLTGIRIIAYYQDDALAIGSLIEEEFVVRGLSGASDGELPGEFGYRSAHYIVQLSDTRASLIEWGGLGGLKAEIQVRTVLQHAWAAISHKLQYKREEDVPRTLRRKLSRLSALFEIADDEFSALKSASGVLVHQISERLSVGDQRIAIDKLSVRKYLETSPKVKKLSEIAEAAGFTFDVEDDLDEEEDKSDSVSQLIQLAGVAGLRTIEDLDQAITTTPTSAQAYLSRQYRAENEEDPGRWGATPGFICQLMLIGAKASHIRASFLEQMGWDIGIASRVLRVAREENG
ncbi:MAG TPA: hypothetical protein VF522_00755 [Ramlibacter sp.]|uniref:GTP pyrophosphokinase n=1 Tax=Ramlibacter sp. TaxID=1917967 RepID=UPI002ED3ACDE